MSRDATDQSYPMGILPPYHRQPERTPPPGYHPYPFCRGYYEKYCPNPWSCSAEAVWIDDTTFRQLHLSTSPNRPSDDDISKTNLIPFLSDYESREESLTQEGEPAKPADTRSDPSQNQPSTPVLPNLTQQVSSAPTTLATPPAIRQTHSAITHPIGEFRVNVKWELLRRVSNDQPLPSCSPNSSLKPPSPPPRTPTVRSTYTGMITPLSTVPRAQARPPNPGPPPSPPTPTPAPIRCKWGACTITYPTQQQTLEHIKADHIGSRKMSHYDFTCRIRGCPCGGKVFEKRDNVVSHVTNVAFDIRYAICPFKEHGCGVALKREWDLPRHIKICKFNPEKGS
ncbi:hypothetical protein ABW20_dc0103836 [Dactylellina cionopaga]|nr:hypothetical protein ABW20_dc0103836 [Dactylellina cionopaga]